MFTCGYESKCKEKEALAKKEYLGEAKGIKLLIRRKTWHPWTRNSDVCHSGCCILNDFHRKKFANFIKKNVEAINKIE